MLRMPPSLLTKELASQLQSCPNLPENSWYFIAGSALSTLNRPHEAAKILKFALEQASPHSKMESRGESAHQIARKMRESMIKLTAIAGLPKTINALLALKSVTPPELQDQPLARSPTMRPVHIFDVPSSRILQQGQIFFDSTYGKVSKRVMGQMDRSGTEDLGIMARLMYGYVLSNTSVLTAAETSYVLIAGLIPQDVNPQLKGHLKGALNNGAKLNEVRAVRALVKQVCEIYGMRELQSEEIGNSGWRTDVADL